MWTVLAMVSVTIENHDQKQCGEAQVYSVSASTSSPSLKEIRAVCGGTLLSGELLIACLPFYNSQGHLSRGGTTSVSCNLPHQSSISQGSRAPQALPQAGLGGMFAQVKFPLPQMTQACVKLM